MPVRRFPMPVVVRKSGTEYLIVEKNSGKIKGRSKTRAKAEASARARNAALSNNSTKEATEEYLRFFEAHGIEPLQAVTLAFASHPVMKKKKKKKKKSTSSSSSYS